MPVKKIEFIDKKLLTMYKEAQESVPLSYNHKTYLGQNSLAVEKQSADFLHSFIEGQISIADDAYDVMREYLAVLKKSSYKPIIENVKKAERIFKLAVISQNKQKTIAKRKTKELISEESLKKSNFSILKGKSGKNLSIAELLYIAQILDKEEKNAMKARKDKTQSSFYSLQAIRNFKNLLQTLSQKKIDEILQGVTPYTSEIAQLSSRFGTNRQKDQISNMAKSIAPVATVSQSTSPSAEPVTVSHPQKEDKKNDDEDESLAAMHTEQEEFDDDDFEDEEDNQEEQPVTSTASTLEAFREPVDAARLEFLRRNDFAVLRNKYRKTLSARDLILIAHMLKEEQKKALIARKNKKSSFYSLQAIQKFNNSAQSLAQTMINDVLQRKTPYNSDIDELVNIYGSSAQSEQLRKKKDELMASPEVILPLVADQKKDKKKKAKKKKTENKNTWYKGFGKFVVATGIVLVSVFGLAKVVPGFFRNSSNQKDNKPKTEQKADIARTQLNTPIKQIQAEKEASAIDYQTATSKIADNHTNEVKKEASEKLTKDDIALNKRIDDFKVAQKKLGINLDDLDEIIDAQIKAGKIEISENLTITRAKYVIAFYAQYPGSVAGKACKALLNGKDVKFNKDDFNKWNEELGNRGVKFSKTLKKTTKFSPMDYANSVKKTKDGL